MMFFVEREDGMFCNRVRFGGGALGSAYMILLAIGLALFAQSALAGLVATIKIDPGAVLGPVNRGVLGNNVLAAAARAKNDEWVTHRGAGIWSPEKKQPVDEFVSLAKEAGVSSLRWPGGDRSRSVDWKKTIGPLSGRSQQQFGLPEFLSFCESVGAQPVITLTTGVGNESDAADMVEYLNAPISGGNPNGGADWAAVRAADGRKEPWNVIWFEYGNEEFNTSRSLEEYVLKYPLYQARMKAVDPRIKLGAIFHDSTNVDDGWTATVLQRVGKQMDFAIIHPYLPVLNERAAKVFPKSEVGLAAVSSDMDLVYRLGLYREQIKRITGRSDVPLAATEYNGNFTQELPVPYRQTLVNALHNADFVRVFLKPESNIAFANFWNIANGYWGMSTGLVGKEQKLVKQANYYVYELYNHYLGNELIKMDVDSPRFQFMGGIGISPRMGMPTARKSLGEQRLDQSWGRRYFKDGSQGQSGNTITVDFDQGVDANYYHAYKEIEVEPDTLYKLSVKVRTIGLKGGKVGIAVEDVRGWDKTFSQPTNAYLTGTTPWSWVTVEYRTLGDARKLRLLARRNKGDGPVSGRAEFGEIKMEKIKQAFGAVESVVGTASTSAKGDEVYLVLINKNLYEPVETTIQLAGNYHAVNAESLSGTSPFATNLVSGMADQVKVSPVSVEQKKPGVFTVKLPASSLSGIKFKKN